ncbi:low-specificity L-threonine aldolase [Caldalkalibacillus salinus]|uniref:low-specificity L-threonine aldolase n=1 Tax=Caldalkalibacillus salinus TaxID=2803787 RepID=UPI001923077B|nr:low-specificity L-threonine aldolase [Caldalkalibacillus salinus]
MIDLRSDTVTKPTEEMKLAMFEAAVGDDVYGEDPTVNELELMAAQVLGKEAALFVTSGTQGNQIAVLNHTRPGDEVLLEEDSHLFLYEGGAMAGLAGVQTRTIQGVRGQMPINELEAAIRTDDIHFPETALICLENTHNRAGGAVVPLEYMWEVYTVAQKNDIPVHLDGARLWNAAVALDVSVSTLTQYVDTVQVCLSKGLSAPMGSILAGPRDWIDRARKWRKKLGGGMRQAGHMAAPGLLAIRDMVDRLTEDHRQAKALAAGIAPLSCFEVDVDHVETNIVLVDTEKSGQPAQYFIHKLKEEYDILATSFGPTLIRLMTHREITDDHIQAAVAAFRRMDETL